MTNNRSTNEQIQERVNFAADELAKGKRAMDISKKLASKYNVSIQQARDYVRQAKPILTQSISPNDRAFIFSKVMSCLEQDRLDARKEENLKEQTKSTGGMVKISCTNQRLIIELPDAKNSNLFKNFYETKKKLKHGNLDALDGDVPVGRDRSKKEVIRKKKISLVFLYTALVNCRYCTGHAVDCPMFYLDIRFSSKSNSDT